MFDDRYDGDPLARMKPRRGPVERREVPLARGLVVEHSETEWCGAVVGAREGLIQLEDFRGKVRAFPLSDGFLIDGEPVRLVAPKRAPSGRQRTASGSFATAPQRARVAMPSRIFVEGKHDAELVEQVWGDDLRVEGVVVELLQGADNLADVLAEFGPGAERRAGVLLDHLVPGSKESRIADAIARGPHGAHVLIVGHPFVDIWQAVKPGRVGLEAWPVIPRSIEWKKGICLALGWPGDEPADIADAWSRIRGRVRNFRDLEPELVGRVEHLIDFVTVG
ncbi:DUF3097 domain-containing protein [Leucobacter luti]|uniref:DUF3097 family protein n=1 Tax=Leucobacter luti TaxID=340320 RepID=A0A4Q7TWE4_9MICO|nr:DUF3097 domain-containing protein [Leucobacter luti]MBL3698382.1 DUF3097 domain-containing protein [Leucobacter luti]RZT64530.1 DUF3097 family protein [Leucobacter luti]